MVRPTISIPLANVPGRGLTASAYGSTMISGSFIVALGPVALEYLYDLHPASPATLQAALIVHVFLPVDPNVVPSLHGLSPLNLTNHGFDDPLCRTQATFRPGLVWWLACSAIILTSSSTCNFV